MPEHLQLHIRLWPDRRQDGRWPLNHLFTTAGMLTHLLLWSLKGTMFLQAVTLEAMRGAHRQQRACYLYAFSGPQDVKVEPSAIGPIWSA